MIVQRKIKSIEVEIDTSKGNEVYLPESLAMLLKNNDVEEIINVIYDVANVEHIPLSVFIELTDFCNFSCPFCYINEHDCEHKTLPEFKLLKPTLDFLIDNGLLYCTLSGGECLMHPEFKEIYLYLKKRGVLVSVFSNGYLFDEEVIELFKLYKPFKVEISIYGKDDLTYRNAVANESVFANKVYNNILQIKNIGVDITCKTPLTSLTEDSFYFIEKWCESQNISFYSDYELQSTYSGISRNEYFASEKIRLEMQLKSTREFYEDFQMVDLAHSKKKKKLNFDCAAGKTELFISSKYQLLPCMKAIGIKEWSFDIESLGIQQAYINLIQQIKGSKDTPIEHCCGCTHHKVCQECFFTQFDYKDIYIHRKEYCKTLDKFCNKVYEDKTIVIL